MKITRFFCFARETNGSGNPAAVVENFVGSDLGKQQLAAELGLPVTVFIEEADQAIPLIRFFYPAREMQLCLHGSLAGAKVMMESRQVNSLQLHTLSGQTLDLSQRDELIQAVLARGRQLDVSVSIAEIEVMLRIKANMIDQSLPCCVASIGSPKLLVPLQKIADLHALHPDFAAIKTWSLRNNVNGLYVYSKAGDREADFIARGFNPKGGLNEDPATGVSAGALISILPITASQDFVVNQGDAMGAPSRLFVSLKTTEQILVGGRVVFQR